MTKRLETMIRKVTATCLFWVALFVNPLSGCAPLFWMTQKPHVDIAGIVPMEIRLLEQTFLIELRIQNPTEMDLDIAGLTFELEINGQPFARGVSNKSVKVKRLSTEIIQLKAYTGLADLLRQISEARKGSYATDFTYHLKGVLYVGSSFLRIPFDETGKFK